MHLSLLFPVLSTSFSLPPDPCHAFAFAPLNAPRLFICPQNKSVHLSVYPSLTSIYSFNPSADPAPSLPHIPETHPVFQFYPHIWSLSMAEPSGLHSGINHFPLQIHLLTQLSLPRSLTPLPSSLSDSRVHGCSIPWPKYEMGHLSSSGGIRGITAHQQYRQWMCLGFTLVTVQFVILHSKCLIGQVWLPASDLSFVWLITLAGLWALCVFMCPLPPHVHSFFFNRQPRWRVAPVSGL